MTQWAKWTLGWMHPSHPAPQASAHPVVRAVRRGFAHGTHVVSNLGWRPVETLQAGDKVLSFDHGMQVLAEVRHEVWSLPEDVAHTAHCPIHVPAGALRNRRPLWLMPDQGILVESDLAMEDLGDPFAVVPAKAFVGHRGIALASPGDHITLTQLVFQRDQVIYVEGGMLAHCPSLGSPVQSALHPQDSYPILPLRAAKFLVDCHMDADEPQGLTYHPEELAAVMTRGAAGAAHV